MNEFPSNPDVVIVGAGAAGIGASLTLARLGVPHIVLEAKDRVGGRAYSESKSLGHLWDHGCHWFHSADINVLRRVAEKIGHAFGHEHSGAIINTFIDGHWTPSTMREDYVWRMLEKVADAGKQGQDIAAATLLDPAHRFYPVARHWLKLMYSAEPEQISTRDAGNYNDTGINLPVRDGYGALLAKMSAGLPIKLGSAVTKIEVKSDSVEVSGDLGNLVAKAVILAVPARMLETCRISITPGMPDALHQAFQDVPMGWYEKIAIAFDAPVFGDWTGTYADIVRDNAAPLNFELHPFGRPIAITHIAGDRARDMEKQGEGEMIAFAREALVDAFGSDIAARITKGATTHWSSDAHIGGAYACAKPGKAFSRRAFSEALHGRIFLAGEHVHQTFNATAHGAYETGLSAGIRASRLLGRPDIPDDPQWLPA